MFITEKLHPIGLLTDLLSRQRYADEDTAQFKHLKHNRDLCPGFAARAKRVLSDYEKHRSDVHDVQGFSDLGSDVVVGFRDDNSLQRIGLQIKSYDDFKAWWGNKKNTGFLDKLRSQYAQAVKHGGVDQWYLVLCTDAVEHADALREIRAEFSVYDDVKIIDPIEALSFFRMTELDIDIAVSRRLSSNDYVMIKAAESLAAYPAYCRDVIIALACRALEGQPYLSDSYTYDMLSEAAGPSDDASDVLSAIEGLLDANDDLGGYTISIDRFPALAAIYFDQRVRFRASKGEMPERLKKLLV